MRWALWFWFCGCQIVEWNSGEQAVRFAQPRLKPSRSWQGGFRLSSWRVARLGKLAPPLQAVLELGLLPPTRLAADGRKEHLRVARVPAWVGRVFGDVV